MFHDVDVCVRTRLSLSCRSNFRVKSQAHLRAIIALEPSDSEEFSMAEKDFEQDNLFKEIDEDLRQERYADLWKKHGKHVIAGAVLLVVAVGGYQGWIAYDLNQRNQQSAQFSQALLAVQNNKAQDALSAMDTLAKDGSGGYALLARLNRAGLLARAGSPTEAAIAYLGIAADSSVDQIYRDLAVILASLHELDSGDPAELTSRLQPLTVATNPWRHSARELTALLARRLGDNAKAGKLFREIADDVTAPSGIRARAAELSAILGG